MSELERKNGPSAVAETVTKDGRRIGTEVLFSAKDITKTFGGTQALKGVELEIHPGEIVGLVGENGAGKSTLLKIIIGAQPQTSGTMSFHGAPYEPKTPMDANKAGVGMVFQEQSLIVTLNVAQNIFFGHEKDFRKAGVINWAKMNRAAAEVLAAVDITNISPTKKVSDLNFATRQMVEIAKAVSLDAKLIIMDEPTSSLGKEEINQLMETVRGLKAKGVAILFVSHKLEELFELCDRVTVMRDGELIVTEDIGNMTEDSLITAMVGRTLDNLYPKEFGVKGDVWLEAKNLNEAGVLHDVSFQAHAGQITGFAGLVGAGRTETMRAIFGADKLDSGEVYIKGQKVHIRSPKDAIKHKIAFLTEDRKGQGLVLSLDVRTNLILANMKGFSNGPFLNKAKIEEAGQRAVESLRIKTPSLDEVTAQLSGGNQQKVVIGKWVHTDADIFIFDEPTRGIDVGAKIEVYHVMNDLVKAGKCVIMVSSELPEILAMSDHVVVMRGGRVMANIDRDTPHFNSEDIMKAAWGGELD